MTGLLFFRRFHARFLMKCCIFVAVNRLKQWLVWLSRIHRCRGFGIHSPIDYAFVRYVINEHWPYYAYDELRDADWLEEKLGRLYFRLANWRQPSYMVSDRYLRYWQAGCKHITFVDNISDKVELARIDIEDRDKCREIIARCNENSVVVVEKIWQNNILWRELAGHPAVSVAYDLYYCGILIFRGNYYKRYYTINF